MENAAAFRRKLMTVDVKNVKMELYVPEAYVEPIREALVRIGTRPSWP